MPTNVRPRVNEAREFLEIAKDFKDAREIIREALSNSWDAKATKVSIRFDLATIPGTKRKKIVVTLTDDGEGMSSEERLNGTPSELASFFNLGDSYKPYGSIGSKGHGTKIYYKSSGIRVATRKNDKKIVAEMENAPWESLTNGIIPTYRYEETVDKGHGTEIIVDGFQAKQSEFTSTDALVRYISWFTVAGSFGHYFNSARRMDIEIKPIDAHPVTISYGFRFPDQTNGGQGPEDLCAIFGPETVHCGSTEDGRPVTVEVVGALLGENRRSVVPDTYTMMGLWYCKDFIRIERQNKILEEVTGGQYYYRAFLIFANCQQFDLTANRNNIRTDQEEYDLAISGITDFFKRVWNSEDVKAYFAASKAEQDRLNEERRKQEATERSKRAEENRKQRINRYKGRPSLSNYGLVGAPVKEPESEAETALLLQAMISNKHPSIDFVVGDYNTSIGVDLVVEQLDKGIPTFKWAELVSSLDRLYQWPHPPEGYHCIVCYQLGKVGERQKFQDGSEATLVKTQQRGRYVLVVGSSHISIYVLKELLEESK